MPSFFFLLLAPSLSKVPVYSRLTWNSCCTPGQLEHIMILLRQPPKYLASFVFCFLTVLLCSSGWPVIHGNPPASTSKYWHPRHVPLLPPLRLHSYEGLEGAKHIWNVDRKFRTTPESSNPFNSEMPIDRETIILQQRYQETCAARSGVSISPIWELLIKYGAPG